MDRETKLISEIKSKGILPLFYHPDMDVCVSVTKALYHAGVTTIEFTNRGEKALENFKLLAATSKKEFPHLFLGVGTIKTAEQATAFIEAGADFLVSPVFDNSVCDVAYMNKVPWVPGCMTPTEIHVAQQAGCKFLKLFPGNVLGPEFIESIRPLFPGLEYLVTGGVDTTKENIEAWFKAGVSAIGMGSKLISKKLMEDKNYGAIEKATKEVLEIIKSVGK